MNAVFRACRKTPEIKDVLTTSRRSEVELPETIFKKVVG